MLTRLEARITSGTRVKSASLEEVTGSEHKKNNSNPVNQEGVSDEYVTVQYGCVTADIRPRSDRCSKI